MTKPAAVVLPTLYVSLKIAVLLNIAMGLCILALLVALPNREWIMSAFDLEPGPLADKIVWGLRLIAMLGIPVVGLNHLILKRLLAMVATVRAGDPFVRANAYRVQAIAWCLLGLQLISLVIGFIVKSIETKDYPIDIDAGFSVGGWIGVLLAFVLARIFAEGTLMRADLEGTI